MWCSPAAAAFVSRSMRRAASRRRSSRSIPSGPSRCRTTGSPARRSACRSMRRTTCGRSTVPTRSRTTSRRPTSWSATRGAETTRRSRAPARRHGRRTATPIGKCCKVAPPVLVYDQAGNLVKSWGGPGQGYDWPDSNHGITVDHRGNVWLAGNGAKDTQILKFDKRRQVPAADRQARRSQRQQRRRELLAADEDLGGRLGQRGVHRRRLRQSPRHRVRRRHRQVQAALGRLRQQAER